MFDSVSLYILYIVIMAVGLPYRLSYIEMIEPFILLPSRARSCHSHHNGVRGFPGCHGDPRRVPHPLHSSTR